MTTEDAALEAHNNFCKVRSCKTIAFRLFEATPWGEELHEAVKQLRDALFADGPEFHAEYAAWQLEQEE